MEAVKISYVDAERKQENIWCDKYLSTQKSYVRKNNTLHFDLFISSNTTTFLRLCYLGILKLVN